MHKKLFFLLFLGTTSALANSVCVAHRGDITNELENSMAAFRSAVDLGAPVVEFDVRHTRDGVGIILHDDTLRRTAKSRPRKACPLNRKVKSLTYAEIKRNCILKNDESIPTFEQALNYFKNETVRLFVELKDSPTKESLSLLYRTYRYNTDDLIIISFKAYILEKVKKSSIKALLNKGTLLLHVSSSESEADLNFDGVAVRKPSSRFVRKMVTSSVPIGVWVINSSSNIERYFDLGVDFITTDKLQRCLSHTD